MDKTFSGDLDIFISKIRNKEPICLTRFGDGEFTIIKNKKIDLTKKCMGEYKYDPENEEDRKLRQMLLDSYQYEDANYWVGIVCPCCGGKSTFNNMLSMVKGYPTWANLLVNSNYDRTKNELIPLLSNNYEIYLVYNKKAKTNKIPFKNYKSYRIGTNSWLNDFGLIDKMKKDLKNTKEKAILIAAGPFSNILAYQLWLSNSKNIVINIGSILDPQFFGTPTRHYHRPNSKTRNKICIWN